MSCHRLTTSGLESSRSQDTKGAEQLLVSPTRLLGLPEVTGLGCAVENFGEAALLRSVLVGLRSGEAKVSSASARIALEKENNRCPYNLGHLVDLTSSAAWRWMG